jgi:hypothetical protein
MRRIQLSRLDRDRRRRPRQRCDQSGEVEAALSLIVEHDSGALSPGSRVLDAVKILKPETIIRWPRAGFLAWWRWKSRPRGGRPRTPDEIRQLIREMSVANPLWGAPRIHGELLKLGMDVGQTTVAKYIGETTMAAVAGLEDRRHRVDRHVRGADDLVWASVWTSHPAAIHTASFCGWV